MDIDKQSRKWFITINNPVEQGLTHELLKEKLATMNCIYWCMCDEVGKKKHTYHTHVYILAKSPIRFKTIFNKFKGAHIDNGIGSCTDARNYIRKEGKYLNSEKATTNLKETFEEFGEIPIDDGLTKSNKELVMQLAKKGKSAEEIVEELPSEIYHMQDIKQLVSSIRDGDFKTKIRQVDVTYLYGESGVGKTRSIFEKYGAENICRISSYSNGCKFDAYDGQNVLVFEEFDSQIPIKDMLNYLDIYPINLPARYFDKIARYEKVFITSNEPLSEQYKDVQEEMPSTYKAFLRRINRILHLQKNGKIVKEKNEEPIEIKETNKKKGERKHGKI